MSSVESNSSASHEPRLTIPIERFEVSLGDQIIKGEELRGREVTGAIELDLLVDDLSTWDEYNTTLLRHAFSTSTIADEYSLRVTTSSGGASLNARLTETRSEVSRCIRNLKSVRERLPLFVTAVVDNTRPAGPASGIQDVFIVHGHNEAVRDAVARFVRQITDREPTILSEKANAGQTLIEKFEQHAAGSGFAIVLLTSDDHGASRKSDTLNSRARQNVVFEFGYFIGKLGRKQVAALYEADVELPSDISGLLYTPLNGAWQMELAREMRTAGITVDLNRVGQ